VIPQRAKEESQPAFEAFCAFIEEKGNVLAVSRRLSKSRQLLNRWCQRHRWRKRLETMQQLETEQRIAAETQAVEKTAEITEEQRAEAATRVFRTSDRLVALANHFAERASDTKLSLRERAFASATASRFFSAASDVALRMSRIGGAGSFYAGAPEIAISVAQFAGAPDSFTEPPARIENIEAAEQIIKEFEAHPEKRWLASLPSATHPDASPEPTDEAKAKKPKERTVPARMDEVPVTGHVQLRYRRLPFESNGPGDFEDNPVAEDDRRCGVPIEGL
jgi:hypothetical protein